MLHSKALFIAALFAAPAQSAIVYQQTLTPSGGMASFSDFLPNTPSMVWISVSSGTITRADWGFQADFTKYWWELIGEDEFGNPEIYLNGNNYFYGTGCDVTPGAPNCTGYLSFALGLKNNLVRAVFTPPTSFSRCFPFNGQFDVDCAAYYDPAYATFSFDVAGTDPITLTISDTRIAGAVPEPASWAMLIAGFGLVGAALRRKAGARLFG